MHPRRTPHRPPFSGLGHWLRTECGRQPAHTWLLGYPRRRHHLHSRPAHASQNQRSQSSQWPMYASAWSRHMLTVQSHSSQIDGCSMAPQQTVHATGWALLRGPVGAPLLAATKFVSSSSTAWIRTGGALSDARQVGQLFFLETTVQVVTQALQKRWPQGTSATHSFTGPQHTAQVRASRTLSSRSPLLPAGG